jgi:uncharacterized protein involved in response to NO
MAWWAAWLVAARWQGIEMPQPPLPAGWMHAIIMQYHVLPSFIFGFLLTVFPRWLGPAVPGAAALPARGRRVVRRAAADARGTGGQPAAAARRRVVHAGWLVHRMFWLARLMVRAPLKDGLPWHALSVMIALAFGLVGLVFYLLLTLRVDAQVAFVAIKFGGIPMLLPIYFTVCHRMIPFFTNIVVRGYQVIRPMWVLGAAWAAAGAHGAGTATCVWLVVDRRRAAGLLFTGLLIAWWPRGAMPPLLRVLYLGFAWLPVAFALYAWQSYWYAVSANSRWAARRPMRCSSDSSAACSSPWSRASRRGIPGGRWCSAAWPRRPSSSCSS